MSSSTSSSFETQNCILPDNKIHYEIDSWSSFVENYNPENLHCYDDVTLVTRWCVDMINPNEYVIVKLKQTEIPRSITFIKAIWTKIGSLKQFAVLGSYDKKNWFQLFNGHSLYYKSVEEVVFQLEPQDYPAPVRYIKIVLLSYWSYTTCVSIWPFYITCYNDPLLVDSLVEKYNKNLSKCALLEGLSKLRTLDNHLYYNTLKNSLPHSYNMCIDELYKHLVIEQDFKQAFDIIDKFSTGEAFDKYYDNVKHQVEWKLLQPNDIYQQNGNIQPCMRGGHQMCIDPEDGFIYLYGGWDGEKDLGDMWRYNIKTNEWVLQIIDTFQDCGPSPRSCHQMCIDQTQKIIYVLGRFKEYNSNENLKNEFYKYDVYLRRWTNLSNSNLYRYGPPLCFGHQMVFCETFGMIYVFGGNILNEKHYSTNCAKFFSYDIRRKKWRSEYFREPNNNCGEIEPRSEHSLHLDESTLRIYITGGCRGANTINEFCYIDLTTGEAHHIDDISVQHFDESPDYCYAMKSTYEREYKELYMYSGLERYKRPQNISPSSNSIHVYEFDKNKWSCVYENKHISAEYWSKYCNIYPVPRFASQFVYDHINKVNYLFGGNPGKYSVPYIRLNDMWSCKITKPSKLAVVDQMKRILCNEQINLWAVGNPIYACLKLRDISTHFNNHDVEDSKFLQKLICKIIDHYDPNESYFEFDDDTSSYKNCYYPSTLYQSKVSNRVLQNLFDSLAPFFEYEKSIDPDSIIT